MFDNMNNSDVTKIKRRMKYIGRFLRKYLTLVLFSLYVYWLPIFITKDRYYGFYVTEGYVITGVLLLLLMTYSAIRLVNVYNNEMALRFINSERPIKTFSDKLRFIFGQIENRFELAVFGILYVILPMGSTSPGFAYLLVGDERGFIAKIKLCVVVLPILLIIYIISNLSAIKYWDTAERRKINESKNMSDREMENADKKEKKDFKNTFSGLIIGFFLGSMVLMFFFPPLIASIAPLVLALVHPLTICIIIALICVPHLIRITKALIKRRKFIDELKRVCKQRRYVLSKIKAPYKSIFKLQEGESFNVRIGDRRFSCKFITCTRKNRPLYIMKNGIAAWLVRIKFISIDLFSYTKSFYFGWEADCKKVIIINPTAKSLYAPKGDIILPDDNAELYVSPKGGMARRPMIAALSPKQQSSLPLDNGDIVDGYEVYAATAFLNALERDVIDID